MFAMISKEFRELRRDRRTLAMLIVLPVLLLVIFGYAADFTVSHLDTAVVGPRATAVSGRLPAVFTVHTVLPAAGSDRARTLLRDGSAAVVIDTTTSRATAWVDGSNLFAAQTAVSALARSGRPPGVRVLFNPDLKTSWYMVPSLIGLILTFIGTIVTSIGLVREREAGTLEQLAVMPLRPADVILGKITPYFVLAAIDMVLVATLGVILFHVPFVGSPALLGAGAALFLFVVLGMGVLISTLSRTQGQAIQGALLILLPQILLSGMIFPLTAMPWAVRWVGYGLPLTWFTMVSRGVMLRGAPLTATAMWVPLVVLTGMAAVIFTLAVLRFRAELAPTRGDRRPRPAESTSDAVKALNDA